MGNIQKFINVLIEKDGIIDREAKASVGMLCKRVEILEKDQSLSPNLFKNIAKEIIYEQSRVLKKLCRAMLIPSIQFVEPESKEKE